MGTSLWSGIWWILVVAKAVLSGECVCVCVCVCERVQSPCLWIIVIRDMVRALSCEDVADGRFTLSDVLLPLPGMKVMYPLNDVGQR